ncbi:hypothetical protein [Streptomyces sp. NPDC056683]|uniref:hypothetical protein n=1 Tax=Streptomyces sp. NPDC056683 TaxID=3345910 RepID=UPI00367F85BD
MTRQPRAVARSRRERAAAYRQSLQRLREMDVLRVDQAGEAAEVDDQEVVDADLGVGLERLDGAGGGPGGVAAQATERERFVDLEVVR